MQLIIHLKMFARQCSRINPEQRVKRERNLIFEFQFATTLAPHSATTVQPSEREETLHINSTVPLSTASSRVWCQTTSSISRLIECQWTQRSSVLSQRHTVQFSSLPQLVFTSHHQGGKVHARFVTFISFIYHITFSCSVFGSSGSGSPELHFHLPTPPTPSLQLHLSH